MGFFGKKRKQQRQQQELRVQSQQVQVSERQQQARTASPAASSATSTNFEEESREGTPFVILEDYKPPVPAAVSPVQSVINPRNAIDDEGSVMVLSTQQPLSVMDEVTEDGKEPAWRGRSSSSKTPQTTGSGEEDDEDDFESRMPYTVQSDDDSSSMGPSTKQSIAGLFSVKSDTSSFFPRYFNNRRVVPESNLTPHMIQWKYMADEGPLLLRIGLLLGASGCIATSFAAMIMNNDYLSVADDIISTLVIFLSLLVLFLESRFSCCLNPQGFRARLRILIVKNNNMLRLVWGRGILCIFIGLLHIAHFPRWQVLILVSGGYMVLIGIIAVVVGFIAGAKLDALRYSADDDEFLEHEFLRYDGNNDGYINMGEFAYFLSAIGLEFDDMFVINTFHVIDKRRLRKISFPQFLDWWYQSKFTGNARLAGKKNSMSMV